MNAGVRRQRERLARERSEREDGPLASDEIVRYSCDEKYELGACPIADGDIDPVHPPSTTMFPPGTIETYTGDVYNFENPDVKNIHLADIAHALSNHCRYAGHTKRFYSVGEHSILVKEILRAQGFDHYIQLAGLFHDAHEAYVMDAPRPLKPLLGKAFEEVADKADVVIATWLGRAANAFVRPEAFHMPDIKTADNIALVYERLQLMTAGPDQWEPGYENVASLPESLGLPHLGGSSPLSVEGTFLRHARDLGVDE